MEPEERATLQLNAILDKIWENFLLAPGKRTEYELQEPDEARFIPDMRRQIGIIKKIEKNGRAISNVKQNGNILIFDVDKERFKKYRKAFKNPKASFQSYRLSKANPIILPDSTKWEHITMKFLNGNDVRISLKNDSSFKVDTTYNEMGFRNHKSQMPNKQWQTLLVFAQNEGSIAWTSNSNLSKKITDNLKAQKKLLSQTLKDFFQLDGDPFFTYNKQDGYRLKATLIPEKQEHRHRQSEDDEIADFFNEQVG
jgi:hypothetical protein